MKVKIFCLVLAMTFGFLKGIAQIEKASLVKMHLDSIHKRTEILNQHTIFTQDPEKISKVYDILIVYELAKEKLLIVEQPTDEQRIQWEMLIAERNIAISKILTRKELKVLIQLLPRVPPKKPTRSFNMQGIKDKYKVQIP